MYITKRTSNLEALSFIHTVPIEKIGVYYYLEYGSLRMRWDEESSWFLTLDEAPRDQDSFDIGGLCGNYDRDPLSKYRNGSASRYHQCQPLLIFAEWQLLAIWRSW